MTAYRQQADLFAKPTGALSLERKADELVTKELIRQRHSHPAWQLLASPRAPLVLGCLKPLFDAHDSEIPLEDARMQLSKLLTAHANNPDFNIQAEDYVSLARKELRNWINKGLLVERNSRIFATDALQTAFRFIESIQERIMTSTASRLSTVQQQIESLEARMDPDKKSRQAYLKKKIAELQKELSDVEKGEFEVLEGPHAQEELREIYSLAMSLRADFRRVEDSYRDADRDLRQSIIRDENNRGEIVERLLSANQALLNTPEGQVFSNFYEQVARSNELDKMRIRLRNLLSLEDSRKALTQHQSSELRSLVSRLVHESENVMRARARSEKDVRGFIKTGLAGEHHRVGKLLDELFDVALQLDWSKQQLRRSPSPLHPVAPAQSQIPLPERIGYKAIDDAEEDALNLEQQQGSLDALAESYSEHCRELDRSALYEQSLNWLREQDTIQTIGKLATALQPEYDLESLSYWLTLAREAELPFEPATESVELQAPKSRTHTRFHLPIVQLDSETIANAAHEDLE